MKLISVQNRGDRIARVKLLDKRLHHSRTYLYKLEKRTIDHIVATSWNVQRFKFERTALKAAAEWLEGART